MTVEEVWELAKEVEVMKISISKFKKIFPEADNALDVFRKLSPYEVKDRIEEHTAKIGDIIKAPDGEIGLVMGICGDCVWVIENENKVFRWLQVDCAVLGHSDILDDIPRLLYSYE